MIRLAQRANGNYRNVIFGVVIWILALFLRLPAWSALGSLDLILLFAILVVTPLALKVVATPGRNGSHSRLYRWLLALYLPAALLAALSFAVRPGVAAAVLALPWLLFTAAMSLYGLKRLVSIWPPVEEVLVDFGLLYVVVGGFWMLLSRAGLAFFTFREPIITLTAIHFHYISLAALVISGMIGRMLRRPHSFAFRLYRLAAGGMIVGPVVVALGISFSIVLEAIGALLLTVSLATIAILALLRVVPALGLSLRSALISLSSATVLFTMLFAAAYAFGRLTDLWALSIPTMILIHGWVNALGFALAGLLAWAIEKPKPHVPTL